MFSSDDASDAQPDFVTVRIDARDPLTKVSVRDVNYIVIREGYGEVDAPLARTGTYDVCFTAGGATQDRRIRIAPNALSTVECQLPRAIPFGTTAPLSCGLGTDAHAGLVSDWVEKVRRTLVADSAAVFFCLRSPTGEPIDAQFDTSWKATRSGEQYLTTVNAFNPDGIYQSNDRSCVAAVFQGPGGEYVVRPPDGIAETEFVIPAVPGWITFIFCLVEKPATVHEERGTRTRREPSVYVDLASISLLAIPITTPFDPDESDHRWCELTRLAALWGSELPTDALLAVCQSRATSLAPPSPILLLQVASLLLHTERMDVAERCIKQLPAGWDVVTDARIVHFIVRCRRGESLSGVEIASPPVLALNWPFLVELSFNSSTVARYGTLACRVAVASPVRDGLLSSWVAAQLPPSVDLDLFPTDSWPEAAARWLRATATIICTDQIEDEFDDLTHQLHPTDWRILWAFTRHKIKPPPPQSAATIAREQLHSIAEALRLPPAALDQAIVWLCVKVAAICAAQKATLSPTAWQQVKTRLALSELANALVRLYPRKDPSPLAAMLRPALSIFFSDVAAMIDVPVEGPYRKAVFRLVRELAARFPNDLAPLVSRYPDELSAVIEEWANHTPHMVVQWLTSPVDAAAWIGACLHAFNALPGDRAAVAFKRLREPLTRAESRPAVAALVAFARLRNSAANRLVKTALLDYARTAPKHHTAVLSLASELRQTPTGRDILSAMEGSGRGDLRKQAPPTSSSGIGPSSREGVTKTFLINKFRRDEQDSGSPEVQIALLTARINGLTEHMRAHTKDFSSRRGLLKLVSRRSDLLKYLRQHDRSRYLILIAQLGLRK